MTRWVSRATLAHSRGFEADIPAVIATKYTTNFRSGPGATNIMTNFTGNGTKSLHVSVNNSLKNLKTDYIDLVSTADGDTRITLMTVQLYVHWWDYSTSIPELMQSLNQLVSSGKVLYLGISDTPAWVVRYGHVPRFRVGRSLTRFQQSQRVRKKPRASPVLRLSGSLVGRFP